MKLGGGGELPPQHFSFGSHHDACEISMYNHVFADYVIAIGRHNVRLVRPRPNWLNECRTDQKILVGVMHLLIAP